jgi:hypothetical protein
LVPDDHDAFECIDDLGGPGPAGGEAKLSAAAAVGEPGGQVQHPEAE